MMSRKLSVLSVHTRPRVTHKYGNVHVPLFSHYRRHKIIYIFSLTLLIKKKHLVEPLIGCPNVPIRVVRISPHLKNNAQRAQVLDYNKMYKNIYDIDIE